MHTRIRTVAVAILLMLATRPAAAQRDDATLVGATVRAVYCPEPSSVRAGNTREWKEGTLVSLDTARLVLQGWELHALPIGRTLSIERRTRESHRFIGVLIGAPLGFALGAILGRPTESERRAADGFAGLGVAIGELLGTLVGIGVGSAVAGPGWEQVPLPPGAMSACR
jgi:hypothetical protein